MRSQNNIDRSKCHNKTHCAKVGHKCSVELLWSCKLWMSRSVSHSTPPHPGNSTQVVDQPINVKKVMEMNWERHRFILYHQISVFLTCGKCEINYRLHLSLFPRQQLNERRRLSIKRQCTYYLQESSARDRWSRQDMHDPDSNAAAALVSSNFFPGALEINIYKTCGAPSLSEERLIKFIRYCSGSVKGNGSHACPQSSSLIAELRYPSHWQQDHKGPMINIRSLLSVPI